VHVLEGASQAFFLIVRQGSLDDLSAELFQLRQHFVIGDAVYFAGLLLSYRILLPQQKKGPVL
jgi:hypothetical protein